MRPVLPVAHEERKEFEATSELAALCGYHPLALRIAAGNLLLRPDSPIADAVENFRGGNLLDALAAPDDPATAVRTAFDTSYAALSADGQQLFRRLGLIPGADFPPEAVAALNGTSLERTRALLEHLQAVHLISQQTPGRYRLHDLVRIYAKQRAEAESDHEGPLSRLFGWYLQVADAAAAPLYPLILRLPLPDPDPTLSVPDLPDQPAAVAWLEAELSNLLAAAEYAANCGPHEFSWLLADLLRGFFMVRGHTEEWAAATTIGRRAAEDQGDLVANAAMHNSLTTLHVTASRLDEAVEHSARALELSRQASWRGGEAAALANTAAISRIWGDLDRAGTKARRNSLTRQHRLNVLTKVGWPRGISPLGSHRSGRNSLPLPGSCHPDRQAVWTHAQWAKSLGYWRVMRCQHARALWKGRSRLYFLRIQRIR
ncbi:MAG TPA: hypothetical protein VJT49_07985 [Amycolatopsis sp.]|uniref:hypothetical protein n=1 Tax=Amycolatopsis sp. TaxID=37632 RepID=UPI002B46EDE1|nr:hypothetical protein [Amycolatopsis sp.]HKS45046.1 hypothetical protein [Amycolatopsis sp.]